MTLAAQLVALNGLQRSTAALCAAILGELPVANVGDQLKALSVQQVATAAFCGTIAGELPAGTTTGLPVIASHPRFWGTPQEVTDLLAKAATPEGKAIIAAAVRNITVPDTSKDVTGDRLLWCAFVQRFGAQLIINLPSAGAQGVTDLMATPVTNWGVQADVGWGDPQWAIGRDWLDPLLTAAQKSALASAVAIALAPSQRTYNNPAWAGYNQLSGDVSMAAALATYGETPTEYVDDVYQNNWFAQRPGWWNYWWMIQAFTNGGSGQGIGYFLDGCYSNFGTAGLWKTAVPGDASLDISYFQNAPYWMLFQCDPDDWAFLATSTFAWGTDRMRWVSILKACTTLSDPKGQQLARWMIDQTVGWGSQRTAGDGLLFGLLIGDPRVKGVDPSTLGVPLSLTLTQPGEFFARSDWTPQANVVWFGNHTTGSRVTPAGEFMLYSKGTYLFGNAATRVAHSYAPRWMQCGVCFVGADGTPDGDAVDVGSIPDYVQRGTFAVSVTNGVTTIVADCLKNFNAPKTGTLSRVLRTFVCDPAVKTISLTDDILCSASLTPHLVFPCPTQPVLNPDGTVTFMNGPASCVMSFDVKPADLIKIGGPRDYCDGLPGTTFAGVPYLLPQTVLDSGFSALSADAYASPPTATSAASMVALNKQVGVWRLHVALPAGGGKITTTISVK